MRSQSFSRVRNSRRPAVSRHSDRSSAADRPACDSSLRVALLIDRTGQRLLPQMGVRSFFRASLSKRTRPTLRQQLLELAVPPGPSACGRRRSPSRHSATAICRTSHRLCRLPHRSLPDILAACSFKALVIGSSVNLPLPIFCLLGGEQDPNSKPGRFQGSVRVGVDSA